MRREEYNQQEENCTRQEYEGIEKCEFRDLFDLDNVQRLTDAISEALEVGILIVSPDGTPITRPSNFCDFCRNMLGRGQEAGLEETRVDICIAGMHLASWVVGQIILKEKEPDVATQRERARLLGVEENYFTENFKRIPRKSKEQFERILALIEVLSMQLAELGLKTCIQKEELSCRIRLEDELRMEKAHLEFFSKYDELTGVLSRSYYEGMLDEMCRMGKYPITVISADMNNLKLMNDVFGHQYGDQMLEKLGEILRVEAKPSYLIGRCGGDEFNIAIPFAGEKEAEDYLKRIEKGCRETKECMVPLSVAMGYQTMRSAGENIRDVVRQADTVMYNAKVQKKQKQNINSDIMDVLFDRQYLLREHIDDTVKRIGQFAAYLKLREEEIEILKFSARIQDVGLIAVPEAIVRKSELRTAEEKAEMEKHTEIGYRLAKLYEESFPVAKIILQSHECWDGLGYPDHLKGKEILYEARILYIVTVYSYWISRKPDRPGMDVEEARRCLKLQAGKQFDPVLTEKFSQYLEKQEPME